VLGLQFLGAAPWTEELIEGLLLKNVAREFPPGQGRVLVVDGDATRLSDIADSLRVLGCSVLEARNPVEAVWELENGLMDVHTVFIARRLGTGDGRDLVRFIGSRYAGVRRVMLADRSVAEAHEADVVVVGPFDPRRLRKVIPGALLAAASGPRLRLQSA
jgi:CheY-like chemotaxis protein